MYENDTLTPPSVENEMSYYEPQMQMQPQMQPQQDINAQIEQAKEVLGVNALIDEIHYKDNLADAVSNHPELSKATIESELAKIEANDPTFAKQIKTNKTGFEIFVKGLISSIAPQNKADEITDDSTTTSGAQADPLLDKINKGGADKFALGEYINTLSKKRN